MVPNYRSSFPGLESSVAEARRFVADRLATHGRDALAADLVLVASELATNAVRHARAGYDVVVDVDALGPVRLAVRDPGPGRPVSRREPGRGLTLVDAVCDRWGITDQAPGKEVWCFLGGNSTAPASSAGAVDER